MFAALLALLLPVAAQVSVSNDVDGSARLLKDAFDLAYNLDREEAVRLLEQAAAAHPGDPALHRGLASVMWLEMLFGRGAVTVDHYLGDFSRTQVELKRPPPELDAAFRLHAAKAIEIAQARVRSAPGDARARYDLGAAIGLQASYTATVEGRLLAGFRAARGAYDEHERVLRLDPSRKDAGLIVGLYRYMVSTLSAPMRMMAYVAGFGGGRERGIQMLEETAAHGGDARVDAMFALILVYNRERQYDNALRVLGDLRRMYPRNRLVVLEMGATLLRAGRAEQADVLFTDGLRMMAAETRPLFPGEQALWRYKRGTARAAMQQTDAARADLNGALTPDAQEWVRGRANAELARMAIHAGDAEAGRTLALRAASLCTQGGDRICAEDARSLVRSARGR